MGASLPRIGIVACGGTIASTVVDGVATPRLRAADLTEAVPALTDLAEIVAVDLMSKASPDTTLEDALLLLTTLRELIAAEELDGVVVTHGTDTLEEVAFALDLLWEDDTALVVTGAMRNPSLPGPDGAANLASAVATAASPTARGLGALVVANDEIHAARFVRKTHTSSTATFASPSLGPLGTVTELRPSIPLRVARGPLLRPPVAALPAPGVPILTASIGDDDLVLRSVVAAAVPGIVLAGFGGGHLSRQLATSPAFEEALGSVPVVLSSRSGAGSLLRATYGGFAGSETELLRRGVIGAGHLDAPKARVLLTLLLAAGASHDEVRAAFLAVG